MGVAGHVDLGDHRHEVALGMVHDAGPVGQREPTALVAPARRRAADAGERRPVGHLDAPPLIVAEVEVQAVQLEARDQLDEAAHLVGGERVPGHVEHRAAPLEARGVDDADGRHRRAVAQLVERAGRVPQAVLGGGGDGDDVVGGDQLVPLGAQVGSLGSQFSTHCVGGCGHAALAPPHVARPRHQHGHW